MPITSKTKRFPIVTVGMFLLILGLSVPAIIGFDTLDSSKSWSRVIVSIAPIFAWFNLMATEVVEIHFDEDTVTYRRRLFQDLVINTENILEYRITSSRIKYRYATGYSIDNFSLPLKRFERDDRDRLIEWFNLNKQAQQVVAPDS